MSKIIRTFAVVKIKIMKQVNLFKSFSNPSYLGADRLWADRNSELSREDIIYDKDYDDV